MRVERKSGRLLRGIKPTRYKENSFLAYWQYWLAVGIGVAIGLLAGFIAGTLTAELGLENIQSGSVGLFVSLPTLVLVYNLVLTLLQQIQRSGIKASAQTPYWLPVTWQEHTLASILASLLGYSHRFSSNYNVGNLGLLSFCGLNHSSIADLFCIACSCIHGQCNNRNPASTSSTLYWCSLQIKRQSSCLG